jgi:opacity protein-like surface antigen
MNSTIRTIGTICAFGLSSLLPVSASAQMADWIQGWTGQATLYGWLPVINGSQEGPSGQPLVDLDTSDVLSALDMAFMGAAEFRKGKFGLLFDAVYADLSNDGKWVQNRVDTKVGTKVGFYTAAVSYRVYDQERTFVDVYGGARFFDTSASFDLGGTNFARSFSKDLNWTDGIVGLRGGMPLSEKWSLAGFADVGGFDAGSDLSWEVYGGANYAFAEHWAGTLGYRYVSIEKAVTERAALDISIQGPLFGVTYKF